MPEPIRKYQPVRRASIAPGVEPGYSEPDTHGCRVTADITIYQQPHSSPYIADIHHPQAQP